jgi:hypothetical protein
MLNYVIKKRFCAKGFLFDAQNLKKTTTLTLVRPADFMYRYK